MSVWALSGAQPVSVRRCGMCLAVGFAAVADGADLDCVLVFEIEEHAMGVWTGPLGRFLTAERVYSSAWLRPRGARCAAPARAVMGQFESKSETSSCIVQR